MPFQRTAQKIIDDSIKSALYIDNKIAIPFRDNQNNPNYTLCSQVFSSFDRNNTNITFYHYKKQTKWEREGADLLKSRDLLILDWKLQDQDPQFLNALQILKQAVQIENIFCVAIYTDSVEKELPDISHNICCYFSDSSLDTSNIESQIIEKLDEIGIDSKFIYDSLGDLISLAVHPHHSRESFNDLRETYKIKLQDEFDPFESFLKALFGTQQLYEAYKLMGYVFNKCIFPSVPSESMEFEISDNNGEPYFLINNTFIFIESKIDPKILYPKIKNAIINSSSNFLPIMGLEMRNAFNNSSAMISKKLSSIDEYAFMHHQNNIHPEQAFYEFLKELWKNQSFHFLLSDDKLKVFAELNSYKRERNITIPSIRNKIRDGGLDKDLGKLNCFYNLLISNKTDRCIGFGDIFKLKQDDVETNRYILCITAHCDCLYPQQKLDNNLYFVRGDKNSLAQGLEDGDTGFNTFIEDAPKNNVVCIKWKDKPITIYIPEESNKITSDIPINIGSANYVATYNATLKENYTQRMANRAFAYPLHVGIFFADKKKKQK